MSDMSANGEAIRIDNVSKRFGETTVVNDVSLTIAKGEFFSLLGPSGCGKTTTLRMLAGFETPTSGQIMLEGEPVDDVPPYRRNVNMVFQSYALFEHLDIANNVGFGLEAAQGGEGGDPDEGGGGAWSWSGSGTARPRGRRSSPAARSSAWRWRGRWSTARRCCCSTSPWARWT